MFICGLLANILLQLHWVPLEREQHSQGKAGGKEQQPPVGPNIRQSYFLQLSRSEDTAE